MVVRIIRDSGDVLIMQNVTALETFGGNVYVKRTLPCSWELVATSYFDAVTRIDVGPVRDRFDWRITDVWTRRAVIIPGDEV